MVVCGPTSMLHGHDDGLHPELGAGVHDLLQHQDHALAALQTKSFLRGPFSCEILF